MTEFGGMKIKRLPAGFVVPAQRGSGVKTSLRRRLGSRDQARCYRTWRASTWTSFCRERNDPRFGPARRTLLSTFLM
jgi:hypothetical protein